jgi:hypothetical protein
VPTGCVILREIESLVKGAHPRGHALSAGIDDFLYSSFGRVYLLFPVSFHSRDQMITEMLLHSVFTLKRTVIPFDTTKLHNGRWT